MFDNKENDLSNEKILLIKDSLNKGLTCPFDNVDYDLPDNVPCKVCGSLGGSSSYCIKDFVKPV